MSSATTTGATDISVGIDGSVWVTRIDPSNDKGTSEVSQYLSKSDSFVTFGPTATAIAAFDFIYAGVTDTLSTSNNPNVVQTSDVLGINSMIMKKLATLLASYMP